MKEVVSVSLGPADRDYDLSVNLLGKEIHIRRLGCDGNAAKAQALVRQYDGQVDVIGLGGARAAYQVGQRRYVHRQLQSIVETARTTPVVDGLYLKNILERWAVKRVTDEHPELFRYRRVLILTGVDLDALAQVVETLTNALRFADPVFQLGLPWALTSRRQLDWYARLAMPWLCTRPYQRLYPALTPSPIIGRGGRGVRVAALFRWADVIVGEPALLLRHPPDDLSGKTIVTDSLSAAEVELLRSRGIATLITSMPLLGDGVTTGRLYGATTEGRPYVGVDVIEAVLRCLIDKPAEQITADDFLNLVADLRVEPQVTTLHAVERKDRFAFVIHPLRVSDIYKHPILRYFRWVPSGLMEWAVAQMRPIYVSKITGIRSQATGKEVEGVLLSLGATPKQLMRHDPSFSYRRLIVASRMAERLGAKIMGLGAFTSVVGDAGITVAQKADIAITSGNSLTVTATLEAAKQAVIKMGGRTDQGRAVVIGATGSIGAVCARLLAQAIGDVVLVAPRPEKLIDLKRTIEAETPGARVTIATRPDQFVGDADLVVTTTSALTGRVLDVTKLKPGCVVCDVARPPDVREEDAALRPDVLVIESGEIRLPGDPDFGFDIGLPPKTAYACLAETALLTMEGIFEDYTLGRNIEMERVKEMYRLFKKHGLELAGLRSFGQYITDEDIAHRRALADDLRQHPEKLIEVRDSETRRHGDAETNRITASPRLRVPASLGPRGRLPLVAAGATIVAGVALWRRRAEKGG